MTKKIPTKTISKQEYGNYLKKAREFLQSMRRLQEEGSWNSTALEGIHAAILVADAVLIYTKGYKSSSQRHADIETLIAKLSFAEAQQAAHHLTKILNVKNLVEYSGDSYLKEEALAIAKHVERFFSWAEKILPK